MATARVRHINYGEVSISYTRSIVGDFGLAISSLAAVDPSDVSPQTASAISNDFTTGKSPSYFMWKLFYFVV